MNTASEIASLHVRTDWWEVQCCNLEYAFKPSQHLCLAWPLTIQACLQQPRRRIDSNPVCFACSPPWYIRRRLLQATVPTGSPLLARPRQPKQKYEMLAPGFEAESPVRILSDISNYGAVSIKVVTPKGLRCWFHDSLAAYTRQLGIQYVVMEEEAG